MPCERVRGGLGNDKQRERERKREGRWRGRAGGGRGRGVDDPMRREKGRKVGWWWSWKGQGALVIAQKCSALVVRFGPTRRLKAEG